MTSLVRSLASVGLPFLILSCAATPPPMWDAGGAPLVIPTARWDRENGDTIEIQANGHVLEDGDMIMMVDRAGRVVDEDYEPLAILLPDGHVAGTDDRLLGRVGVANAAPPGAASAWLAILPNGQVVRFDSDGERESDGVWHGCDGPKKRTCTLIMHVMAVRNYRHPHSGPSVGVGVGVML